MMNELSKAGRLVFYGEWFVYMYDVMYLLRTGYVSRESEKSKTLKKVKK